MASTDASTEAPSDNKPAAALPTRGKMRFKTKLLLILISLGLMVLLRTGFVFFIIGMLPAIVAYLLDFTRHRYTFKCIFAANLSGMLPYVMRLIASGGSNAELQTIMGSASNWIIIYGAALLGLVLIKICPLLAQAMVNGMHQTQILRCEWLQKKLESEWGPEVKQFSHVEPPL